MVTVSAAGNPGQRSKSDRFTPDMETFDEALDRRIWSLADTRFQWDKRIAENRKNVPQEIGATVAQTLEHHHPLDTEPDQELEDAHDVITNDGSAEGEPSSL